MPDDVIALIDFLGRQLGRLVRWGRRSRSQKRDGPPPTAEQKQRGT